MQCTLQIQPNGLTAVPRNVLLEFKAPSALALNGIFWGQTAVLHVPLNQNGTHFVFPAELRNSVLTIDVDIAPSTVTERALVPCDSSIAFRASVHGMDAHVVAVPAILYRGLKLCGWNDLLHVTVNRNSERFSFERKLSVRGKTVTLALPKKICLTVKPGDEVEVQLSGTPRFNADEELSRFSAEAFRALNDSEQNREIVRLVSVLASLGFPHQLLMQRADVDPIGKVQRGKITVDGDVIKNVSTAGQATCNAAHLQRYAASYKDQSSVVEAYTSVVQLERAVRYQIKVSDPVDRLSITRALSALNRGPMNFPPVLARWIVDTYAPANGAVFDPCSGYGGRLLGALASTKSVKYIGADIEIRSAEANIRLAELAGERDRVMQFCRAAEGPDAWPKSDLVIIGPPYYTRENYGSAAQIALQAFPTYPSWVNGFIRILLERALASAPCVVVNVGTLRDGKSVLDLPGDVIKLATTLGGVVEHVWNWQMRTFGTRGKSEAIIVIKRAVP